LFDLENPTVAPYVGKGQVRLRLVCRAARVAEAIERLAPLSDTIMARAGEHWIGTTDTHEDAAATRLLPQRVGERLRALGWRLAVAESCTGGLVSARLTDVPGSSDYIHANFVTYGNAAKSCWLGVDEEEIARHGAVSSAVALAMAEGARRVTGAQVGLSLTGIAGPGGGTEEKPVGLLFVGLSVSPDEGSGSTLAKTQVFEVRLPAALGREEMKFLFSQHALFYVLKALSSVAIP
jgi:nicotinamide-nucleotide amidase